MANGRSPWPMMRALHENLGISAEVLLKEPGGEFPDNLLELEWQKFPVVEMARRCWLPKVENIKEKAEELMRGMIDEAGGLEEVPMAFFRQGKGGRYNSKMDPYALTAWCIRVMALARRQPLQQPYVNGSIQQQTFKEVARLSYFENGPQLAREFLGKQGIHLIVVPHLPRTHLDGAAMLMSDGTPVIGLTLRYDRIDNFWFTLLHELAHVARHLGKAERIIVDDLDLRRRDASGEDKVEKEADVMAREGLIPGKVWENSSNKRLSGA